MECLRMEKNNGEEKTSFIQIVKGGFSLLFLTYAAFLGFDWVSGGAVRQFISGSDDSTKVAARADTVSEESSSAISVSPVESAQNRCLASIRNSLLNPETAEFYDFTKIETDEKTGESGYSVRVRAEGQLGNRITKNYFCGDFKDRGCVCIPG